MSKQVSQTGKTLGPYWQGAYELFRTPVPL